MMETTVHVAVSLYDPAGTYAQHLGACLTSLFANAASPVCVHLMHDATLSRENRARFDALADAQDRIVVYHDVEPYLARIDFARQPSAAFLSPATASRLFLPELLPDVGRIVYLDADMIVDMDIGSLWNFDLRGAPLGAVPDLGIQRALYVVPRDPECDAWATGALARWKDLGIPLDRYFNAGTLLLDLHSLRDSGLFGKALAFLDRHPALPTLDQDALNAVFHDTYAALPFRYNVMLSLYPTWCAGPCIWHFTGTKPWMDAHTARQDRYALYLAASPWGNRTEGGSGAQATLAPASDATLKRREGIMQEDLDAMATPESGWLQAALGLPDGAILLAGLDNPEQLTDAAWDCLARLAALLPQGRLLFGLAGGMSTDREQALRDRLRRAFAEQGAPLERCVCFMANDPLSVFGALAPQLRCALSLSRENAPALSGNSAVSVPLITLAPPEGLRQRMRLPAGLSPDQPEQADALVELVLNVAARSPYGRELAALLPDCRAASPEAARPLEQPLLCDLEADARATVELSFTNGQGLTRVCRTRGLDVRGQVEAFYGRHRSGWAYATDILRHVHNPAAAYFETFIERRFSWGEWMGERLGPILKPWVGIVHVPLEIPPWFGQSNVFTEIAKTRKWQLSAPYCRGLFTLTHSLRDQLRTVPELERLPLEVLPHPTEFVEALWSPERYAANAQRALVQIGSTYRNLHAIHCVPQGPYQKWLAMGGSRAVFEGMYAQEEAFLVERGAYQPGSDAGTTLLEFLDDAAYDALFTQNVIFAEYYAASATNLVLECLARNTPLLVNPLPAIVEYLGPDYPLYFSSYEEAGAKAADMEVILRAHAYLTEIDKTRFTREYFLESILNSGVYAEACRA